MTRKWVSASFCLIGLLCVLFSNAALAVELNGLEENRSVLFGGTFDTENITITTTDNLKLKARLYNPRIAKFPGKRPAVIFTNSWTLDQYEYEIPARILADKGYIVLSYATRGFRGSEGTIQVGGPNEVQDMRTMIDWLELNTRVDVHNIGLSGVSYGGGIALLAAAQDPRVKTVAAMSSWANLEQALYGNGTIRKVWLDILLGSGHIFGEPDPMITELVKDMYATQNEEAMREWARTRSALSYVDQINARGMPVLVANSYQDGLFPPLQMRDFYEKLTVPKKFYLDEGLHATSAIPGIFGLPSPIWNEVYAWFDHYLGKSSKLPRYGIVFHGDKGDEVYQEFPRAGPHRVELKALNKLVSDREDENRTSMIEITGNKDSGATSGIPILTDLGTTYLNRPPEKFIWNIKQEHAAVFQSDKLEAEVKLRGAPRVSIVVGEHPSKVQIVAYLYDVDGWNKGKLITHGVMTIHAPMRDNVIYELELAMIGYDIPKGHSIALVLDTKDPLYNSPLDESYTVKIMQDEAEPMAVELPIAH